MSKLIEKLNKLTLGEVTTGIRDLDGSVVLRSGTTIKDTTFLRHGRCYKT
jgi:DNA-directed RNA polymerase subunit beta